MNATRDPASETPDELRRLAAWHRAYAEIGGGDHSWRIQLAAYLERRADEQEKTRAKARG